MQLEWRSAEEFDMSWKIDHAQSQIQFAVQHRRITHMRGGFERFGGTVEFDEADPAGSRIDVQVEAASLNTADPGRDQLLCSPDFLDVTRFPYLTYRSRRAEKVDATHWRITGDLTIHNVSHEVALDVEYTGQAHGPSGTVSAGFNTRTRFRRKSWGLHWNQAPETGEVVVGDEVAVDIALKLVKQAGPARPPS
jgi:polyisoprenoid-binding protein YceI